MAVTPAKGLDASLVAGGGAESIDGIEYITAYTAKLL